jgi:glutamyl-tRNA reductase
VEHRPRQLLLLGVDFTTAPLAVRERLTYLPEAAGALLRTATGVAGLQEAVIVSTCNRTEFYLAVDPDSDAAAGWIDYIRRNRPDAPIGHDACELFRAHDTEAARHLFRVSCGLESSILGDVHIGGQLKQALAVAGEAGALGPFLNQAFQHAFRALRTARSRTDIGRGHASLGSAVAGLLDGRFSSGLRVTILGSGVAARDIGRQLAKRGTGVLTVVGRTPDKADELARQIGAATAPWTALDRVMDDTDVLITATAAPRPIVARDRLERCLAARSGRRMLVIDVGMPRNVETVEGVECLTIDDIAAKRDEALARRQQAVPAVEAIIEDEILRWSQWVWARPGEDLIRQIFIEEQQHRAGLVDTLMTSGFSGTPEDLDRLLARSWSRILHGHARGLRQWLRDGSAITAAVAGPVPAGTAAPRLTGGI